MARSAARVSSRLFAAVFAGALAGPPTGVAVAAQPAPPPFGQSVIVAGTGEKGYSGDGQRATDARIGDRGTIDVGPDGTLYIADESAKRIRAVNGAGVIDTVPGTRALRSPANDGPMVNGWQHSPSDGPRAVAAGKDGALYIAGRETVRRLGRDGSSTLLAEIDPRLIYLPDDLALDDGGNVYLSGRTKIHKIDPAGKITPVAGGGTLDPLDADGRPATEARLSDLPVRIAVDGRGTVYVVVPRDSSARHKHSTLHRIDPDGTLRTVAGGGEPGFAGDGGPAATARLSGTLGGVAVAVDGTVYVYDAGNGVVRAIGTDGVITSLAPPVGAGDLWGSDLAVGPRGDVYVKAQERVHMLVRNPTRPTARPVPEPGYPARFPHAAPGTVHTVAGSGRRDDDLAGTRRTNLGDDRRLRIAVGPDGSTYYCDAARHRVMRVAADGTASVLAGTGEHGFGGDGGDAARATLKSPTGVAVGRDGSVYIADSGNNRVRMVDPTGVIKTIAGTGGRDENGTVHGDGGPATAATVTPVDVAVGPDGSLYLAEGQNRRISRVTPDGIIRTFAGHGQRWLEKADGHPAPEAGFIRPMAVAVGPTGAVYLLDEDGRTIRPAVRMIDTTGIVRTVAGDSYRDESEAGFGGDGGPAAKAELNNPRDIATGPDGTLYIADTYNARIRAVDANGTITTVAGTGQRADSGDGAAAAAAAVNEPATIDVDSTGRLHTITLPGDRIRTIDRGTITTTATVAAAAHPSAGKPATEAPIDATGTAVDHDGTLLVADRGGVLHAVSPDGTLSAPSWAKPELGPVHAVAVGADGTRYLAAHDIVYRVSPDAAPVPIAGGGPHTDDRERVEPGRPATLARFATVVDLAVSPTGRPYIATNRAVYRLTDEGTLAAAFTPEDRNDDKDIWVSGIAVDREDRLYVAVSKANRVYRVDPDGHRITMIVGTGSDGTTRDHDNGDGGDATEATLDGPADVAVDPAGNLYIGTYEGIRRVTPDGTITTVAPNPWVNNSRGSFDSLALDRHGDLYYADHTHKHIRLLTQPAKITEPFDWTPVVWIATPTLTLTLAGLALLWWRRRSTPRQPTTTEPATSTEE